jgi:DNA-binding transcriptional ArsR family regulator
MVRDRELTAGEIASHFDVSRPAISQHLAILKEAGLIVERHLGTRRLYRARPEGLAELRAYLDEFWSDQLERLKEVVERE